MDKTKLQVGKKYIRKRKVIIDGVPREAECFLKCEEITTDGAVFSRYFEPPIVMTNTEIATELRKSL